MLAQIATILLHKMAKGWFYESLSEYSYEDLTSFSSVFVVFLVK